MHAGAGIGACWTTPGQMLGFGRFQSVWPVRGGVMIDDNVLYCIDNEYGWGMPEEWYEYWAQYLKEKAAGAGKHIEVTEMNQIDWDLLLKLRDGVKLSEDDRKRLGEGGNPVLTVKHKKMYGNMELFSFIDVGNCMGNSSPSEHWRHMQSVRDFIRDDPHPMNNVKLYGGDYAAFWPGHEGINKFWRKKDPSKLFI